MSFSAQFPPWAMMWMLAVALYAAAKVVTLATLQSGGIPASRKFAYLFLFPGMNAAGFCAEPARRPARTSPAPRYAVNILIGCLLLWTIARLIPQHPLVQGWIGMTGFILMLHFGLLQFPALAWQAAGYQA